MFFLANSSLKMMGLIWLLSKGAEGSILEQEAQGCRWMSRVGLDGWEQEMLNHKWRGNKKVLKKKRALGQQTNQELCLLLWAGLVLRELN